MLFNGISLKIPYGRIGNIEKAEKVEEVTLSEIYAAPSVSDSVSAEIMQVKFAREECGLKGEGTVIAVVDTGLMDNHEAFSVMPTSPALDTVRIEKLLSYLTARNGYTLSYEGEDYEYKYYGEKLKVEDVYKSAKVPFSFDYGDNDTDGRSYGNSHGTHVSGIAAGNNGVDFYGIACDAQIVNLKVFSDKYSNASTTNILAALSDAVVLGVDAVNLSLGSSAGFVTSDWMQPYYEALEGQGIITAVAAGNEFNAGYAGYDQKPLAENPDFGVMALPASFRESFAVASINAYKMNESTVTAAGKTRRYADMENRDFYEEMGSKLGTDFSEPYDLGYVVIPGIGSESDYEGLDVSGKIALIRRGTISFDEKLVIAEAHGAIAGIIYDNVSGLWV